MEKNDPGSHRLLEMIRERVRLSGRSHRELERELTLGHGTLGNIFRGRTELRLRHVAMLSRVLSFETAEMLFEAFRGTPPQRRPLALPVTLEELRRMIIDALREELDRRDRGLPPDEPEESEPEEPEEKKGS